MAANYSIAQFSGKFPGWDSVESFSIETFPWYNSGKKQLTTMKLAIANGYLWWKSTAEDIHSFAHVTTLNGPVYQDSCVEFFLSPRPTLGSPYLNFEVNCCGTLHLAYGAGRENRTLCTFADAAQIEIHTTIATPVKAESPVDSEWSVEMRIPLALIENITGEKLNFETWRANFYRCGGKTEDQYAVWSPITTENPDYHCPDQFGTLNFKQAELNSL
jgi:hypothetical protein